MMPGFRFCLVVPWRSVPFPQRDQEHLPQYNGEIALSPTLQSGAKSKNNRLMHIMCLAPRGASESYDTVVQLDCAEFFLEGQQVTFRVVLQPGLVAVQDSENDEFELVFEFVFFDDLIE